MKRMRNRLIIVWLMAPALGGGLDPVHSGLGTSTSFRIEVDALTNGGERARVGNNFLDSSIGGSSFPATGSNNEVSLTSGFLAISLPLVKPTHIETPTPTETRTPTEARTPTETLTSTETFTPTQTATPTPTNTANPTATSTFTPTEIFTPTPTATPTQEPTATPTSTPILRAPSNLRAGAGIGSIRLVWERNVEDFVRGYNLYRATNPNFTNEVLLNGQELLIDPVFIDELELPRLAGATLYYQVEAVGVMRGGPLRARSETAMATEGTYSIFLPDVRGVSNVPDKIKLPVSTLNARGIGEQDFIVILTYPDIVENVSFEITALSERFATLNGADDGPNLYKVFAGGPKGPGATTLSGEGAFFNFLFDIKDGTPNGATGEFRVTRAQFNAGGVIRELDIGKSGILTVTREYRLGDVNGDGDILFDDLDPALAELALGRAPTSSTAHLELQAADMNADGVVDVADVILLDKLITLSKRGNGESLDHGLGQQADEGPRLKGADLFELKLVDSTFPSVPGLVKVAVSIKRPVSDLTGVAAVALTVAYATDVVELAPDAVEIVGSKFDRLFYDQRDYIPGFVDGRVNIIVDRDGNSLIEGDILEIAFRTKDITAIPPPSEVRFKTAEIGRETGEKITWYNSLNLEPGRLFFESPPFGPAELLELLASAPSDLDLLGASVRWYEGF